MSETLDLKAVERKCIALAGIKKVSLTAMENIDLYAETIKLIDSQKVYSIYFRNGTGGYTEKSSKTSAGSYITQSLTFFTPKKRFDIQYIISQLLDNRCAVQHESYDGDVDLMVKATMAYSYSSGTKRTDRNGTQFNFTAITRRKEQISITSPEVENQDPVLPIDDLIELPNFGGPLLDPSEVTSNTTGNNFPSFFVEVLPQQIPYQPTPEGNSQYLNKFITANDGFNYFIDHRGNAMQFSSFPSYRQEFSSVTFDGNSITCLLYTSPSPRDS